MSPPSTTRGTSPRSAAQATTASSSSSSDGKNKAGGGGKRSSSSVFSVSSLATALMALYMGLAFYNLYRLMFPLTGVDLSRYRYPDEFVKPLWQTSGQAFYLRVYLTTRPRFRAEDLKAGYQQHQQGGVDGEGQVDGASATTATDVVVDDYNQPPELGEAALLWDETVDSESPSFSKSFLLTTCSSAERDGSSGGGGGSSCSPSSDPSYRFAADWLDHAEHQAAIERGEDGEGIAAVLANAGHGIESTSILLTFYQSASRHLRRLLSTSSSGSDGISDEEQEQQARKKIDDDRTMVRLSPRSALWQQVQNNSTLYVHVLVLRRSDGSGEGASSWPPPTSTELRKVVNLKSQQNSLLTGQADLVKFELPHHVPKPSRILLNDVTYIFKKYVLRDAGVGQRPPWEMEHSAPDEYGAYQRAQEMKLRGTKCPYWKPEVAIKYVSDRTEYPIDFVAKSGMPIVQVTGNSRMRGTHPTGYSYTPAIHVDEIGLTSEKYLPVNETVTSLPLRISFDRNDADAAGQQQRAATTATAGGISPARWRLLSHLSQALESQKQLGFDQSDIDDLRRLIADTNVTLLAITLLASALHLLFEFLTFKNEVHFWQKNQDLTGLSVRSLFLDTVGQTVILLYLLERDSSLLITIPSGIGCLIALWKCQRAAGLKFVRIGQDGSRSSNNESNSRGVRSWYNVIPRLFGYELRATRLEIIQKNQDKHEQEKKEKGQQSNGDQGAGSSLSQRDRLTILTIESDRIATRTLGTVLLPVVVGYAFYSLSREQHSGWFSWLVTTASSAVCALGFVLMTPQLFLNYKMKSVAHLPWRVLVYKSLNTFIDDLFSFIIRMPTMARISCFRDDVVFFVYLYQRWLYPVDATRPIEGGGDGAVMQEGKGKQRTSEEQVDEAKKKKNQ